MRASVRDSRTLRSVNPDDLVQYLVSHNWSEGPRTGRFGATYNRQIEGSDYEVLVPLTREIGDFSERISEVLRTLETVEKRSQIQILSDLTSVRADVVRIRRPDATDGTIALEDGASLINSALDMVLAAACATVMPRGYYPGKKPTAATDYLRKTRLGQSERGSYVLTVISPVPPRTNQDLVPGLNDPFERQVTRMLSTALSATIQASESALRRGNVEPFRESMNQGVNANLLDGLLGLMGPNRQSVGITFAWSPEHPVVDEPRLVIIIEPDFVPVMEEASRVLKKGAQLSPVELLGVVIGLRRPEGAEQGRATLIAVVDGKLRTVNVELGSHDYDSAITAHQTHRPVMCEGDPVRLGRATVLTNMTGFRLAPETEQEPEDQDLLT
jgi:hypothetical protein